MFYGLSMLRHKVLVACAFGERSFQYRFFSAFCDAQTRMNNIGRDNRKLLLAELRDITCGPPFFFVRLL